MTSRSWTAKRGELVAIWMLDWLEDQTREGRVPRLDDFINGRADLTVDDLRDAVDDLKACRHLEVHQGWGGWSAQSANCTSSGRAVVRVRRDRRQDARARAIACREALLDWFYAQKRAGAHYPVTDHLRRDTRGHFEGDPFTEDEVRDAGEHLLARELIRAVGAFGNKAVRGEIVASGETVVEDYDSDLGAWTRSGSAAQYNTHFHAQVSGQVGIGHNVTQTQQPQPFDPATVAELLRQVKAAAEDLPGSEGRVVTVHADVIDAETQEESPAAEQVKGSLERIKAVADRVGNAGLSAAVGALVRYFMENGL